MFVARKNAEAVNVEDQKRLDITGLMHVGDLVNCFRAGSLVMRPPENELAQLPSLLFGTVGGMIGVVMTLPATKYNLLRRVQENLTHIIHGVGGFTHSECVDHRARRGDDPVIANIGPDRIIHSSNHQVAPVCGAGHTAGRHGRLCGRRPRRAVPVAAGASDGGRGPRRQRRAGPRGDRGLARQDN